MTEADQLCTALRTKIHKPFIWTVQINKGNFSICRKKIWKLKIHVLNITLKRKNLLAEILENRDVQIFDCQMVFRYALGTI